MNYVRNMKRPRLATILAGLALFIALGGTAAAAGGLINGKKIKKGTVTAKQIKNQTISTGKLAPSTLSALKGAQGPRGEKGAKGETGAKGDTGAPGVAGPEVVNSFSSENTASNVPANSDVDVISFNNLPSSKYLVIAKSMMFSNVGGNLLRCDIATNNNGGGDEAQWTSPGNSTRNTVPMVLSTATKVTQVKVQCNPGNGLGSFTVSAVAIPIG